MTNDKTGATLIEVRDLTKKYGKITAVYGINFAVKAGEIFGILGPNGAGKTTTMEIMEALRRPDSGTITIAGLDARREPLKVKNIIGVQLQSAAFYSKATLNEQLQMFAGFYGRRINAHALLADVNLLDKAKSFPEKLSGGQRQRFSIAVALVNDPRLIFLDEPTTGLDPQARLNLWELIEKIRARGVTVILTSHYMEEAERLCDRVAIMDAGKIIALDSPANLIKKLLQSGFKAKRQTAAATLEDVYIDLTGKALRE
ncbi:MAG: ABC transporter ATP-binding protein [Candidatus Nomurabacteria bacterium]|nr:ABC transporter ATP-binding protein [Candidatus Nomurabacteria bacterium]